MMPSRPFLVAREYCESIGDRNKYIGGGEMRNIRLYNASMDWGVF